MRRQTKTLMALASVCLLMAAGGVMLVSYSDESDASTAVGWEKYTSYNIERWRVTVNTQPGETWSFTVPLAKAQEIDGNISGLNSAGFYGVNKPAFTYTMNGDGSFTVSGSYNSAGTYNYDTMSSDYKGWIEGKYTPMTGGSYRTVQYHLIVNVAYQSDTLVGTYTGYVGDSANYNRIMLGSSITSGSIPGVTFSSSVYDGSSYIDMNGSFTTPGTYSVTSNAGYKWNFVIQPKFSITFDSMGGSSVPTIYRENGEQYGDLPTPTKEGYDFAGWYYTEWDGAITGPVGSNWTAYTDLTLWAKWNPSINYAAPPATNIVAGTPWSHQLSTTPAVSITVSGAEWLSGSVGEGTISGTPPVAGSYDITVVLSVPGYASQTHTFTLTVVSALVVTNSPSNGAIFYQ